MKCNLNVDLNEDGEDNEEGVSALNNNQNIDMQSAYRDLVKMKYFPGLVDPTNETAIETGGDSQEV